MRMAVDGAGHSRGLSQVEGADSRVSQKHHVSVPAPTPTTFPFSMTRACWKGDVRSNISTRQPCTSIHAMTFILVDTVYPLDLGALRKDASVVASVRDAGT